MGTRQSIPRYSRTRETSTRLQEILGDHITSFGDKFHQETWDELKEQMRQTNSYMVHDSQTFRENSTLRGFSRKIWYSRNRCEYRKEISSQVADESLCNLRLR